MITTKILDFNSFYLFDQLTNVNVIATKTIPFLDLTSIEKIVLKHQGILMEYIPYPATLDLAANVGKFTVNTTNQIVFIIDKATVTNVCMAKEYIVGFIVEYVTEKLSYTGTPQNPLFRMKVMRGSDGIVTNIYTKMTMQTILQTINSLGIGLDLNTFGGNKYVIEMEVTSGVIGTV